MFKQFIAIVFAILLVPTLALAQNSYRVKPGDTLNIEVLEDPSLNRSTLVLPDGTIAFPFVGSIQAAGRSIGDIRSQILSGIASNFQQSPTVFVSVAALARPDLTEELADDEPTISIYALGEVASPGKLEVSPGTTLLQFLAENGGFTRFAATKRIQLRRRDPQTGREFVYNFNYNAVSRGAPISTQTILAPGDVIVVPERRLFE